jgi:asparagine synthetase B (glutamine-hydrolysing)
MCGICYIYKWNSQIKDSKTMDLLQYIKSRGPDSFNQKLINPKQKQKQKQIQIIMYGAVLHFQGKNIQTQPIYELNNENPSMMLWNGEVFISNFMNYNDNISDTTVIFEKLLEIEKNIYENLGNISDFIRYIQDILENIGGPYSIIYYASRFNITIVAKDPLGRRSLIMHLDDSELIISSVSCDVKKKNHIV